MKNICAYCGKEAIYQLKNGKWCCEKNVGACPEMKRKNSEARKKQIAEQKLNGTFKCNFNSTSNPNRVVWNKGLTKETDDRIKNAANNYSINYKNGKFKLGGYHHTLEARNKISKGRCKYLDSCKAGFSDVGWYKIKNLNGEEFTVRGTWERDFGNYLTDKKILWIRNKQLKYIQTDNSVHRYNPDFYLPDKDLYIEVKGYFSNKDQEKIKLVLTQHKINLKIIREAEIKKIKDNPNILLENIVH